MLAIILAPLYILLNVYLARWVLRWTGACHHLFGTRVFRILFVAVYAFASTTPLTSFLVRSPAWLRRLLGQISNYWFGWMLYLILTVLLTEGMLYLIRRARHKDFVQMQRVRQVQGGIVLAVMCAVCLYGMGHAKTLYQTEYNVAIDKQGEDMTIALLADLHMGYSTDPAYMEKTVQAVNAMQPDLIVFAGDIFDNQYEAIPEPERLIQAFSAMKSTYGSYACWGNHDVSEPILAGFTWDIENENKDDVRMHDFLTRSGITLLTDERLTLSNGVQLVGRKDPSWAQKTGGGRMSPDEILEGLDENAPILVIDHQPRQLQELAAAGADLDLSGHTHDGQMFPGNLAIRLLWENACGHIEVGKMHSVVTSGVGIWGPDMRVGTKSEIVRINLRCTG